MTTVQDHIDSWRKGKAKSNEQISNTTALIRYNQGRRDFHREIVSFARANLFHSEIYMDIIKGKQQYTLPLGTQSNPAPLGLKDFVSVIQLEVAFTTLEDGTPDRKVCTQFSPEDTTEQELKFDYFHPKFRFDGKNAIIIYPIPPKTISNGLYLDYNTRERDVSIAQDESDIGIPWYLLDVLDLYLDYRYQKESTGGSVGVAVNELQLRKEELKSRLGLIKQRDNRGTEEEQRRFQQQLYLQFAG